MAHRYGWLKEAAQSNNIRENHGLLTRLNGLESFDDNVLWQSSVFSLVCATIKKLVVFQTLKQDKNQSKTFKFVPLNGFVRGFPLFSVYFVLEPIKMFVLRNT